MITNIAEADETWRLLAGEVGSATSSFDLATLADLPPPAQRFLRRALPEGTPLTNGIELAMEGEIKLGGRWLRFTARQILVARLGFVWAPVVGKRILRFVGADTLGPAGAQLEFRLLGLVPVVRATGPDVERSAAGRLAAETVAWLPQALTPQAGAEWLPIDDRRAIVSLGVPGDFVEVEVRVSEAGDLEWLCLQRWNDGAKPPAYASFGGSVNAIHTTDAGVRIAGGGTVGWDWATAAQRDGEFFRYRITETG